MSLNFKIHDHRNLHYANKTITPQFHTQPQSVSLTNTCHGGVYKAVHVSNTEATSLPAENMDNTNTIMCSKLILLWMVRISCVLSSFPLLFLSRNDKHVVYASCMYILTSPLLCCIFQLYAYQLCHTFFSRGCSLFLISVCMFLGNIASILLLVTEAQNSIAYLLISISVSLGCVHMLFLLNKSSVFRVMLCTAIAVFIVTLSFIAFWTNSWTNRRFYQSLFFPLCILFGIVTNSSSCVSKHAT